MAQKKITDLSLIGAITSALNLPIDDGSVTYRATVAQLIAYFAANLTEDSVVADFLANNAIVRPTNYSLSFSVAASALTIALKNAAGNNATDADPVKIPFRSSTLASGLPVVRQLEGALSTVISSGSTAGHTSAVAGYIHVYAIDIGGGTIELAWCANKIVDTAGVVTTTAEGGAGAADDAYTLYSTTARSNVPATYLGSAKSTQATAGTYATTPAEQFSGSREVTHCRSEVFLDTGTGHGSTNTKIRRFTNIRKNKGTAITLAQSATLGDSLTINEPGIYTAGWTDHYSVAATFFGFSVNNAALTTALGSTSYVNGRRGGVNTPGAALQSFCSWTGELAAGDVFRFHDNGLNDLATDICTAFLVKVSN